MGLVFFGGGNVGMDRPIVAGSLSISPTKLSLTYSAPTGTITVTRVGTGAISAVSSNTGVATVSVSGNIITVTGVSSGSANITISVAATDTHYAPDDVVCTVTAVLDVPASKLAIGSTVYLMENGTAVPFIAVHYGRPSTLYNSSCNGLWLLRKDAYTSVYFCKGYHSGAYESSTLHSYANSTYYDMLGSVEKSAIKSVSIPYTKLSYEDDDESTWWWGTIMDISTKIFVLSGYELGFTKFKYSAYYEMDTLVDGACLSYFTQNNNSDSKRIAYMNGSTTACEYWTRSILVAPAGSSGSGSGSDVMTVSSGGGNSYKDGSGSTYFRPALILPTNAVFDPDTMVLKGVS